jgi:hypothetical protein
MTATPMPGRSNQKRLPRPFPELMRFPHRSGSDPVTWGTAHRDDMVGYVVPGWGQGTAAAGKASRGKLAQIKWQRRHRPAQRSCHAI